MPEKFLDIILGIVIAIASVLVLVPLVSYIISAAIPSLEPLKGGPVIRVLSIVITLIVLLSLTLKWQQPDKKWLVLIYVLLLGAGFWIVYQLPVWVPQIFSVAGTSTPTLFNLSPLWSGIVGAGLLGLLYLFSKKK